MIEVMKQALKALEDGDYWEKQEAITSMRQAIKEHALREVQRLGQEIEQEPDKFVMDIECTNCGTKQSGILTVNTTPPQRTWVGLTEDDKVLINHDANFNQFMTAGEYADRVQQLTEARLRDKNT